MRCAGGGLRLRGMWPRSPPDIAGLNVLIVEKAASAAATAPLRRLAVDSRHLASTGPGHQGNAGAGADLSAPRSRQQLRRRARRCAPQQRARRAVDILHLLTVLRFDMPLTFPDYHAEAPGGAQGRRSMVTRPFDRHELGAAHQNLGAPLPELTVFGMMLGSSKENIHFMRCDQSLDLGDLCRRTPGKHFMRRPPYGRGMTLTNGNALAGRLANGVRPEDPGVAVIAGARTDRRGWRVPAHSSSTTDERDTSSQTRRRAGVGGFPHDVARRKAMFPHAPTGAEHWSPGPTRQYRRRPAAGGSRGGRVEDALPNAGGLGAGVDNQRARTAAEA